MVHVYIVSGIVEQPIFPAYRTKALSRSYPILTVSLHLVTYTKPKQGGVAILKGNDHKNKFLLTNREREVFELLVQDKTTKDIAGQLFISEKTVRNHISNVVYFETRNNIVIVFPCST